MSGIGLTGRQAAESLWGGEDSPDQYIVLGLDTGGTTGWCVAGVHPEAMLGDPDIKILNNIEFWVAGQFTGDENSQCDEILELIEKWPSARLVLEQFIPRKVSMDVTMYSPMRMNAVLMYNVRPRYFTLQQPALAMTTITDDRQKEMGLWVPGQEHARDATKHVFTFLKRQRERNAKAAAIAASKIDRPGSNRG